MTTAAKSAGTVRLLLLGAFAPELDPVRCRLKDSPYAARISCHEIGVGATRAAAETARLLASQTSECSVLFIGSVGAVDVDVSPGSIVCATGVSWIDAARANGDAYVPPNFVTEIDADKGIVTSIAGRQPGSANVVPGTVYTSPSISKSVDAARCFSKATGARFENLELFGVATACRLFGCRWSALCAVTNQCGPAAHEEWKRNFLSAAEATADLLFNVAIPALILL